MDEVPVGTPEQQLARANQEIEKLERAAREAREELQFFVYAASHDLQQPLRAITTHAQLLQREFPGHARAHELTGVMIEAASQMTSLITSLLAYSRNGNTATRSHINLNAPLQWALYNLAGPVREAHAQVSTEGVLPEAFADEKLMATVFENLVSNSLKYRGAEPPRIVVQSETEPDSITVAVVDNGCGIAGQYHEKVFEPFKRLHGKQIPGSGLGLSMCRKIVHAHGGSIWVESDGTHGTAVKFTLPN